MALQKKEKKNMHPSIFLFYLSNVGLPLSSRQQPILEECPSYFGVLMYTCKVQPILLFFTS